MKPDIPSYLNSWSDELAARSNRVRQLIGSAHWLSDGHHKESLLREFFVRYLPKSLILCRGFVKTTRDLSLCSPEVDILVTDPGLNPPFFLEGDLQIVDSSAVIAQIEVKTTFSKQTLQDSLLNISHTQTIIGDYRSTEQIWKGIFFFSSGNVDTLDKLLEKIESSLREINKRQEIVNSQANLITPTCIASLDKYCCFLTQNSPSCVSIKLFKLDALSFPCAFADLFAAIRRRNGGSVLGGLDNVIESLNASELLSKEIAI